MAVVVARHADAMCGKEEQPAPRPCAPADAADRGRGLDRFVVYLFDFGGPVGFRLAARNPHRIAGLIVQNANAYDAGLSEMARAMIANRSGIDGAAERGA